MSEHVPGGASKAECTKMLTKRIWILPEPSSREPTEITQARGVCKDPSAFDEVADQVREQIDIRHPSDGCREQ
jgi:hypothetical protein